MTSSFASLCLLVQHNSWDWINQLLHGVRHLQAAQQLHIKAQVLTEQPLPHWASTSEPLVSTTDLALGKKVWTPCYPKYIHTVIHSNHRLLTKLYLLHFHSRLKNDTYWIKQSWLHIFTVSISKTWSTELPPHSSTALVATDCLCISCLLSTLMTSTTLKVERKRKTSMKDILNAHWRAFLIIRINFKPKSN